MSEDEKRSHLIGVQTACRNPVKLKGVPWRDLDVTSLSCPPVVTIPEPMVTVSSGAVVTLSCSVTELTPATKLQWVRSGVVIGNNSRSSAEDGSGNPGSSPGSRQYFTVRESLVKGKFMKDIRRFERKKWFNLTIENVHPSGSGHYACVAKNGGGIAEGKRSSLLLQCFPLKRPWVK